MVREGLNDAAALCEELGDLLLLVAMHAQLAEEEGTFRIEDVYEAVSSKLIRRHPHVFGDVDAATPDAVIRTWEEVKARERQAAGAPLPESNPVDRLPKAMPAMRKSIEALAPRSTLRAPENDATGGELLAALERLLAQGVDPERALEASLRSRMASGGQNLNESPTMVGATRAGEGSA